MGAECLDDIGGEVVDGVNRGLRKLWRGEADLHRPRIGYYYPSMIGVCLRRQHYVYTVGEVPDDETLAVFATGKGVHDMVADALDHSGTIVVEAKEVKVSLPVGEASLSGRIDLLVALLRGEKVAIEVKSTSRIPEEPYEHQLLQLQTYLHATGLAKGVILYWDKRSGAKKGFVVEKDEESLRRIGERVGKLHTSLMSNTPPLREAFLEGRLWECRRCSFLSVCKPFLVEGVEVGPIVVYDMDSLFSSKDRLKSSLKEVGLKEDIDLRTIIGDVRKRFWEIFLSEKYLHLDQPVETYVSKLRSSPNPSIVLITGRPAKLREATENQLRKLNIPFKSLLMRQDDEYASDRNVKLKWVENLLAMGYAVQGVISSDASVSEQASARVLKYQAGVDYSR